MNYDSLFKVVNNEPLGGKTYVFAFNSQRWKLAPGAISYIPFDAIVRSMGDPRSGPEQIRVAGQGGRATVIPSRRDEIKRLGVYYGTYGEAVTDVFPITGECLLDHIPNITAWNMEGDEEVVFPHTDPDCTRFLPADSDQTQVAVLVREMEKMRRQMLVYEEMAKQAGVAGLTTAPVQVSEEVEEDTPTPVARQRRVS